MKYEDDQNATVYDAVLDTDVLILATPIRWNNHSALMQSYRENELHRESDVWSVRD